MEGGLNGEKKRKNEETLMFQVSKYMDDIFVYSFAELFPYFVPWFTGEV